jgi:hypothetical protein
MATNDPLSPESQRILDEVLRQYGIKPKTATQTALECVGTAAHRIDRIVADVRETPWAITPGKLAAILSLLDVRASGHRLEEAEVRAALGGAVAEPPVRQAARGSRSSRSSASSGSA